MELRHKCSPVLSPLLGEALLQGEEAEYCGGRKTPQVGCDQAMCRLGVREENGYRCSNRKRIQMYTHAYDRTRSLTLLHVPAHRIQTHTQTHAGKENVWYMAGQCRHTRENKCPLRCPLAVFLKMKDGGHLQVAVCLFPYMIG